MNQYYLLVHCLLSLLTSQVILQIPVSWIPVFQTLFSALFSFGFHSSIFHNTHIHFLRFFYLSNIFDSFNPNRPNHSPLNFMRFIWAIWINTYFNLYNKIIYLIQLFQTFSNDYSSVDSWSKSNCQLKILTFFNMVLKLSIPKVSFQSVFIITNKKLASSQFSSS